MLGKLALLMIIIFAVSAEGVSRKDAKEQRELDANFAPLRLCEKNYLPQSGDVAVEVFQVLDLPLVVHEAALVKSDKSYFLKLSLGNNSEQKLVGLRYSLATIDSENQAHLLVNQIEGFSLRGYGTKTLTFKTPMKLKIKDGERMVLMVEQVVSRETIWEVVKAKEALEAYGRGDYSVRPTVLRVPNQVDTPPGVIGIIFKNRDEDF